MKKQEVTGVRQTGTRENIMALILNMMISSRCLRPKSLILLHGLIFSLMQERLKGIGQWLSVNGEAIYGIRPWSVYGEGPTNAELGSWDKADGEYMFKAGDVRYTHNGNILYAILLEWPGSEITLKALKGEKIKKATMLGSNEDLKIQQTADGLAVTLPPEPSSPYANTLRLEY
jgi:alpha-L-fucosidase